MGLGILEARHNPVPGTALVYDDERKRDLAQSAARSHLKYDKTGKILLVPQPSDDPNDPLVRQPCEAGMRIRICMLTEIELAAMETRPHHRDTVFSWLTTGSSPPHVCSITGA